MTTIPFCQKSGLFRSSNLVSTGLLILLMYAGLSNSSSRDVEYFDDYNGAYDACIGRAESYGYTNPYCREVASPPPFVEGGYFWDNGPPISPPYGEAHLLGFYFNNTNVNRAPSCPEPTSKPANSSPVPTEATNAPVSIATGAKFFRETDYQDPTHPFLKIQRTYDSSDGLWVHHFGVRVFAQSNRMYVVEANGSTTAFVNLNGSWVPELGGNKQLTQENGLWVYKKGRLTKRFNNQNRLSSITPYQGLPLTITYPEAGKAILQSGSRAITLSYIYGLSRVTGVELPDGQTITYSYDAQNRLTLVDNRGEVTEYRYEHPTLDMAITSVIDGNGVVYKEITYHDDGRVETSSLNNGQGINSFTYPEANVTVVTNSLGKDTIYHFADYFGKKKVTLVEGVATASCLGANKNYTYYPNGQLQTRTDWKGQFTRFEYNSRGLVTKRIEAEGTVEQRITDTVWHAQFNLPVSRTAAGQTTTYNYDAEGRLRAMTVNDNTANQQVSYSYNTAGLVETIDGARTDVNDITSLAYDTDDRVSSITNALGKETQINQYNVDGLPQSIVDANGINTELSYHPRGWLSEQRIKHPQDSSLDAITTFSYDAIGQITQVTLPDGSSLTYEYDAARRVTKITNNLGESIEYTLDNAGNPLSETVYSATNEIKRVMSRQYDELNRLREVIGASSQTTQFDYDVNDKPSRTTNGRGYSTDEAVDALDRIISITDAKENPVQYTYDQQDHVTNVTDQRGNTTTYDYNGLGQLISLHSPDAGTSNFVYDDAGNLVQRTDARGVVTGYQYDALNRVIAETYPSNPGLNKTYSYDATSPGNYGVGRLTSIEDASGLMAYSYDFQGRISGNNRIIQNELYATLYAYDRAGNVTGITYPSGRTVSYDRNQAGQVITVRSTDVNGETILADSIRYLPFGPVEQLIFGNGLSLNRVFDQDYRLVQQDSGNQQSIAYLYDTNNNIDGITDLVDPASSQTFGYNELDRLIDETGSYGDKSYLYDAVGNRTERVFNFTDENNVDQTRTQILVYEEGSNRLVQRNSKEVVLDANGNTISDRDEKRTFDYDAQNRMATSYKNGVIKATYAYNALGQRVVKQRYNLDENEEPIESRKFVYHYDLNGQMLGETIFNQSGVLKIQRHYVWLDNLPLAQIKETYKNDGTLKSTEILYLHTDHLNAPRAATDQNQNLVWNWASDAFGVGKVDKDPDGDGVKHNVRLRFPGQYHDGETGLYYNYFRDYDRTTGRYVQSDPIGLDGGINVYSYAEGSPIMFSDPLGLFTMNVFAGIEIPFAGGADIGFMVTTSPIDIGVYGQLSKAVGGLAKGKFAVGAGFESGCRSKFDGIGSELSVGIEGVGVNLSFDGDPDSSVPTGGSISFGPQLGVEGFATNTGSFTARDLGRLIAGLIHGFEGGPVIGEADCECQ
ncbi:MAG: hypothetical protein DRQ59_03340 [Gammaproteobacteria bacterium]|nr:MAG: hypothetical protein DRQ59_03340 [Gammaproteobacteria bacterium]